MYKVNIDRLYQLQGDLTDEEFAKKLGVSRSQLWRIRNGHSKAGAEFLEKFKRCFPEESIEDIFFASDVPSNEQQKHPSPGR